MYPSCGTRTAGEPERVAAYNVSFDDLTLADWRAATVGTVTAAFTFSRYELLDLIEAE